MRLRCPCPRERAAAISGWLKTVSSQVKLDYSTISDYSQRSWILALFSKCGALTELWPSALALWTIVFWSGTAQSVRLGCFGRSDRRAPMSVNCEAALELIRAI